MGRLVSRGALGLLVFFAITAGVAAGSEPTATTEGGAAPNVIHQLRIYEIFDGNKKAFHDRFRDHAMRIMKRHDFRIVATWESRYDGKTEFVYLLEWPDEATMKDRWAKFMADEEWIAIKKATAGGAPLVGDIEDRTLVPTDYSPRRELIETGGGR